MSKLIRNLLIGFGVAFLSGFGLAMLARASGSEESSPIIPVVLGFFTFLVLQMMSGNKKEARADDAARQAALSAPVPPGQAALYIYREGFMGKAVGWNVSLDGAPLAQLRSPRFTSTTIAPGQHTLAVNLGTGLAASQNKPADTAFEARAGEIHVFAVKSKMGALSNTLSFVLEPDAQAALKKIAGFPMVSPERAQTSTAA